MSKPVLILDQYFRHVEELFSPAAYAELQELCTIIGGQNWPLSDQVIDDALAEAQFLVAARPALEKRQIENASNLRAVIEVSGAFHDELDYDACFARGIEVLSCAPGFRYSVAEMTVAMMLSGARGLVSQHEAFRGGSEAWLDDRPATDFSLYGASVGFIGFGQIAQEVNRLIEPFGPQVKVYDPWLPPGSAGVLQCELEELVTTCRVVIVAAAPSKENKHLLDRALIEQLQAGALVVLISRAHCVDFDALVEAANAGKITAATDVFPEEPTLPDDPVRRARNVILSPHRAAAVSGGRHPIGDMVVHDVRAILAGSSERQLKPADPERVASLVAAQKSITG